MFFDRTPDQWYKDVAEFRDSDDPEIRGVGNKMDNCPNNPRHGGPGYFGSNKHLDRRTN